MLNLMKNNLGLVLAVVLFLTGVLTASPLMALAWVSLGAVSLLFHRPISEAIVKAFGL